MPEPEQSASEPARPDALMVPDSFKVGATLYHRIDAICTLCEGILGGDRSKQVTARVRKQSGGRSFVTLDPFDSIEFPATSGKSGPRYNWVVQPNGIEYGYLVDAAKETPGA